MNKKTLTLVGILVAIAAGLIYAKTRTPGNITISPDTQSMGEVISEAQKFAAAIESGEPYYCEITGYDQATQGNTSLTYHLKAGKMYMTTVTPEYSGYLINDGQYLYSWGNQSDQGSKISIPSEDEVKETAEAAPSSAPSFASVADYQSYQDLGYTINCQPQTVDDSLFVPPANITFLDPTAMIKEALPDGETLDMDKLQEMAKELEPPAN